ISSSVNMIEHEKCRGRFSATGAFPPIEIERLLPNPEIVFSGKDSLSFFIFLIMLTLIFTMRGGADTSAFVVLISATPTAITMIIQSNRATFDFTIDTDKPSHFGEMKVGPDDEGLWFHSL